MLKDYELLQPIAYKILSNTIDKQHFNHAYLFETNGYESGLDMAISFAKAILKIEDKMCNFIKEYVEDNKFYETFFGKDAQFYRRKTMDYIGLTYIYSYLAIAYRDIKNDMEKSQYYWDLYDEEDARIKNIKETDKIPYI